jgi:hypothetical protein
MRRIDLTGKVFGQLRVLLFDKIIRGRRYWKCICSCGKETTVQTSHLIGRHTRSCGCIHVKQNETFILTITKHGQSQSRLYKIWCNMKSRCCNKNSTYFKHYGGKGVSIFPAWLGYEKFCDWALANGYKSNLTIDRIDPDGNYEPNNCQWITKAENSRRAHEFNRIHRRGKWAA